MATVKRGIETEHLTSPASFPSFPSSPLSSLPSPPRSTDMSDEPIIFVQLEVVYNVLWALVLGLIGRIVGRARPSDVCLSDVRQTSDRQSSEISSLENPAKWACLGGQPYNMSPPLVDFLLSPLRLCSENVV